jgi:hypothetical protein
VRAGSLLFWHFLIQFFDKRQQSEWQFLGRKRLIVRFELFAYAVFGGRPIAPLGDFGFLGLLHIWLISGIKSGSRPKLSSLGKALATGHAVSDKVPSIG